MTLLKKVFALILSVIFLFGISVFGNAKYIYWDFSKNSYDGLVTQDNNGYSGISNGELTLTRNAAGGNHPQATIELNSSCGDIYADVFIVETRFKSTADASLLYFQNSPSAGSIFRINQTNATTLRVSYGSEQGNSNINYNVMTNFVQGKWYDLKVVFNYAEKRISMYIDGQEVVANQRFFYNDSTEYVGYFRRVFMQNTGSYGSLSFDNLTVYEVNDETLVELAGALLNISDSSVVEGDLSLPLAGKNNTSIIWNSSDENVITNEGVVSFPTLSQGDKTVTITAVISKGTASFTKQFFLTVPYRITDDESVILDGNAININNEIYDSIFLSATGMNGSDITWSVDRQDVVNIAKIAENGTYKATVTRGETDIPLTFVAVVKKGNSECIIQVSAILKRVLTDEMCVEEDVSTIKLPDSVSGNFELPLIGLNGSVISWTSQNTDAVLIDNNSAKVTRLTVDTVVVLIAEAVKGEEKQTASFYIKVLKDIEGNRTLLNEAVGLLRLSLAEYVYENIVLPFEGLNGTTITWKSSNVNIISNSGLVNRPSGDNKTVNLTATVHKGVLFAEKVFRVTVKGTGFSGGGSGSLSGKTSKEVVTSTIIMDSPDNSVKHVKLDKGIQIFTDVTKQHWAYEYIQALADDGIVKGTDSNNFEPDRNITREEYIKMIVEAMGLLDESSAVSFEDVKMDWYYKYIATAYANGIVRGISDNVFGIGDIITREQMAVIAFRAAGFETVELVKMFDDHNQISPYAKEAVYSLMMHNIIVGNDKNEFMPLEYSTRAQAAKLIYMIRQVSYK